MIFRLLFTLILITSTSLTYGGNKEPQTEKNDGLLEWSGEFLDMIGGEIGGQWDYQGAQLSASIFESLTNIELFSIGFGENDGKVKFKVKRKVYDNHDINDSWTVADYFQIPLTIPIYVYEEIPLSFAELGFRFTNTMALNVLNVRQVLPKNMDALPSIEKLASQVGEFKGVFNDRINKIEQEDIDYEYAKSKNPIKKKINELSESAQGRARYSKFLNLFAHPFRVPINSAALNRMDVGEISSYSLDGSLQLSGNIGWKVVPVPTGNVSMGTSITTYLTGKYRISIFKESDKYVKLKVTKMETRGNMWELGAVDTRHTVFQGIVVLGETFAKINASVIPFSFAINAANANAFDVGYRYDITNPKAREAYFMATKGLLKISDDLAFVEDGVEKIFVRNQKSKSRSDGYKMKLSLLYHRSHSHISNSTDAVVSLPNGEHHIFKGVAHNNRGYDSLWGDKENMSHQFSVSVDEDGYKNDEDGMVFRAQVQLEDSRTNGREMKRYIEEVEAMTGQKGLFPDFPIYNPIIKNKKIQNAVSNITGLTKAARYGRSSFYYRIAYDREQLERFIHCPDDQMWAVVEKAFGVKEGKWDNFAKRSLYDLERSYAKILNLPLNLVDLEIHDGSRLSAARNFVKRWKKLKRTKSLKHLTRVVSKLFSTHYFNRQYLNVLKVFFAGEKVSYFIDARNKKTFNHINKSGENVGDIDLLLDSADIQVEFDRVGTRNEVDVEASITNFKIKQIDDDTVEINYDIDVEPTYFYFRVDKTASWEIHKTLFTAIVPAADVVKDNKYSILIKRNFHQDGFKKHLADAIFSTKYVTVGMAISKNSRQWGEVSTSRIKVTSKDELK